MEGYIITTSISVTSVWKAVSEPAECLHLCQEDIPCQRNYEAH